MRRINSDIEMNEIECDHDMHTSLLRPRMHSTSHSKDMATLGIITEPDQTADWPSLQNEDEADGDRHAKQIYNEMEKNSALMDNNPLAERLRMDALREMPQSLAVKRNVKTKLTNTVSRKSKHSPLSCSKRFKYRFSIALKRLNLCLRDVLSSCELWYSSLKSIEGHFGSGVVVYFKFLRWLFLMNLIVFVISFSFVIVPQLIQNRKEEMNTSSTIVDLINAIPEQVTTVFSPDPLEEFLPNKTTIKHSRFKFGNIFTGEGHLTNSSLYYGGYNVGSPEDLQSYSIPKAYFFTSLFAYLFTFITISVRMARSYRKSFIETSGGLKNVYAHKVFCGWDFSIATDKAAKLKREAIARELKENMEEDQRAVLLQSDWFHDLYIKFIRIVISGLFLIVLTGTGVLVHFLLHLSLLSKLGNISGEVIRVVLNDESASEPGTGEAMLLSFVVTTILIILPKFFSWVVRFEEYRRPRTSLYVTMVRTFLLELVVVAILVIFWLQRDNLHVCWETSLGQEVYRLIMADFVMAVVAMTIAEFIRSLLNEKYPQIGAPGFDISRNTLNLIHNQTLFWVGFFFSPLLSFVMVIKMYLTFHIKKFGLLRNCEPTSRSWRATQTETLFFVFTFIALLCVLVAYGYIITRVYTSDCGLFKGSNYMYEKILEYVFQLQKGNDFWDFLMFLTKPGVVAGVLLTMSAGVYYLRAQSIAQMKMVEILRDMLYAEAKDKEYLLEKLSIITGGHWMYRLNRTPNSPWKRYEVRTSEDLIRTKVKTNNIDECCAEELQNIEECSIYNYSSI